jgi:MtrB/PioB family decaheme-associated outer membrane protein
MAVSVVFHKCTYKVVLLLLLLPLSCVYAEDESFLLDEEPVEEPPAYTSQVEIGAGYNTEGSHRFGQYTGLTQQQAFAIGNFSINQRDDYQSDSSQYWGLLGSNLGLDSRRFEAVYGQQGYFKLQFKFDQLPNNRLDDARTPFRGVNQAQLSLPADWRPALSTSRFTTLESSLQSINIATERKQYATSASWSPVESWLLNFQYQHENKDGTDTIGSVFGNSSFAPFAAILPKAVNQDTDSFDFKLGYAGKQAQLELRYHLSLFNNHVSALTWQNPYSSPRLASFPQGVGRLALEPDNLAHQFNLNAGWRLGRTSRLSASFSYGKMLQNSRLLPLTINPQLVVNQPATTTKANTEVNTIHANLNFSTRPFKKMQLRARYVYDERDNQTEQNQFLVVRNDSENQVTRADSTTVRYNLPYGRKQHKFTLETGYRLFAKSKLSVGYGYRYTSREFSQVNDTVQHSAKIKLAVSPLTFVTGWLQYEHVFRKAVNFNHNKIFNASHSTAFLAGLPADQRFQNDPLLRQFNLANRQQRKVSFSSTFNASDQLNFNLSARYSEDDYNQTVSGLKRWQSLVTTLEFDYSMNQNLNLFSFFTYERINSLQQGFNHNSRAETLAPRNPDNIWKVDNLDQVYTTGAGVNWHVIEDTLAIQIDYTYSNANTRINPQINNTNGATNLPALTTELHSLAIRGDYSFRKDLMLRLSYRFESFKTKDFAQDGIASDTVPQLLSLGNQSPDYDAHLIGLSVLYSF